MAYEKKAKHIKTNFKDAENYSEKAGKDFGPICEVLRKVINGIMPKNSGKIYYNMPVWFINDNPVVGYSFTRTHVNLLFWSGRAFKTPGLEPEGKFQAAGIKYATLADIHKKQLREWLEESKTTIYDYKDIAVNKGRLELI